MIDFQKSALFKLDPIAFNQVIEAIPAFLIDGEVLIAAFKTVRDQLIFTNKRIIAANVQGLTGKKIDYTSIPYSKIQTFSVETSGVLDRDCELEIYISAVGKIRFEIRGNWAGVMDRIAMPLPSTCWVTSWLIVRPPSASFP